MVSFVRREKFIYFSLNGIGAVHHEVILLVCQSDSFILSLENKQTKVRLGEKKSIFFGEKISLSSPTLCFWSRCGKRRLEATWRALLTPSGLKWKFSAIKTGFHCALGPKVSLVFAYNLALDAWKYTKSGIIIHYLKINEKLLRSIPFPILLKTFLPTQLTHTPSHTPTTHTPSQTHTHIFKV